MEVSLASQAHHTPQVGLPQMEPVTRVRAVNTVPTSIEDAASRSKNALLVLRHSHSTLDTQAMPNAK